MSSHPSKCSISCLEQLCGDESTLIQWHRSAGVPHEMNHFSERVNHSCLLLSPPSKQPAAKAASVQERIESKFWHLLFHSMQKHFFGQWQGALFCSGMDYNSLNHFQEKFNWITYSSAKIAPLTSAHLSKENGLMLSSHFKFTHIRILFILN